MSFGPPQGGGPWQGQGTASPAGGPPGGYVPPTPGFTYDAQPPGAYPGQLPTEPMAIASVVVGILSLFSGCCCSFIGIPFGLAALVLGALSINKINQAPGRYSGKPLAIVGIVTGSLSLLMVVGALLMGFGNALFSGLSKSFP